MAGLVSLCVACFLATREHEPRSVKTIHVAQGSINSTIRNSLAFLFGLPHSSLGNACQLSDLHARQQSVENWHVVARRRMPIQPRYRGCMALLLRRLANDHQNSGTYFGARFGHTWIKSARSVSCTAARATSAPDSAPPGVACATEVLAESTLTGGSTNPSPSAVCSSGGIIKSNHRLRQAQHSSLRAPRREGR